jgi:eukaryotic-like serine/threonine-protein kinase
LVEGSDRQKKATGKASETVGNAGTENSMNEMMVRMYEGAEAPAPGSVDLSPLPLPVMLSKPNAYGIRGLDEKIGEWVLWRSEASTGAQKDKAQYLILRGAAAGQNEGTVSPSAILRQPWEAFRDVSFRCVLSSAGVKR